MKFGTAATAAVRDTVRTTKSGVFALKLRYAVLEDTEAVDLYVNGSKVASLSLKSIQRRKYVVICSNARFE